jgi:hypothetical protein
MEEGLKESLPVVRPVALENRCTQAVSQILRHDINVDHAGDFTVKSHAVSPVGPDHQTISGAAVLAAGQPGMVALATFVAVGAACT